MDLFEFNTLPIQYQAQFAWDNGIYLLSRKTTSHVINLYQTRKFYVEVHYSLRNEGVDIVTSFTNLERLEPFLEQISLKQIDF